MKSAFIRGSICASVLWLMAGCSGNGGETGDVGGPPLPIPVANFAVSSSSVAEGGGIEVQVTLSSPAPGNVLIPFTMTGTATRGSDYASAVSPLRIPLGSSSGSIYIAATDDLGDEVDETVILNMGEATHATLGATASTTIVITDTDVPTVSGRVTNSVSGMPIVGATVSVDSATTTTNENGEYVLSGFESAASVIVDYAADGYAPQGRVVDRVTMANSAVNVPMVQVASTLSIQSAQPTVIVVPNSTAEVQVPAGSLRRANGDAPVGDVTAEVTPVSPASVLDVMPGNYLASPNAPVESFGGLDVRFTDAEGAPLNLASGQSAIIRIPASSRDTTLPTTVPLFYYDAEDGIWRQEGTATLAGAGANRYYEGTVTHFATWSANQAHLFVDVTGCVQDAVGTRIPDAVVTVEATSYASKLSTVTNADGNFTLRVKPGSSAFLQAIKGGAVSNSPDIETATGNLEVTPCLLLSSTNLSIKLTWGEFPEDLDSHTLGANPDHHIFYSSLGSLAAQPYIALDVDDVTGYGPEVTTFSRLARNRRYSFYVHNYSGTFGPGQTDSPARVEITLGGTQRVFSPPTGETGATAYWHVFDLTTNSACVVTVVPIQQFRNAEPVNQNVGINATYCE